MNDCSRILALLEVYLDDETTVETNALIHQHLETCESCARQFQSAQQLRASMREALGHDRAAASLHQRVRAVLSPEPRLASFIREWIVPATATAIVALIVLPWRPGEPDIYRAMAVAEHRACALERAIQPRAISHYEPDALMPLLPDGGGKVRIIEAHLCGQQSDYMHVILEEGGTKASVFMARAGEGPERIFRPHRSGDYEVSQVRTTRHRAFVVIDRTHARALREWREPTVRRVQQFLKQLEGT
jgi:mycothiol system anti-sigma-R factor